VLHHPNPQPAPMRPAVPPSAFRLVAAVLAVAGVAFAPGKAAAACGDYVTVHGRSADHAPPTATHDAPVLPRTPCHGPGCSERPAAPVSPPVAPVSVPASPKGLAARTVIESDPDCHPGGVIPVTSESGTVRTSSAIFHPPRAG